MSNDICCGWLPATFVVVKKHDIFGIWFERTIKDLFPVSWTIFLSKIIYKKNNNKIKKRNLKREKRKKYFINLNIEGIEFVFIRTWLFLFMCIIQNNIIMYEFIFRYHFYWILMVRKITKFLKLFSWPDADFLFKNHLVSSSFPLGYSTYRGS